MINLEISCVFCRLGKIFCVYASFSSAGSSLQWVLDLEVNVDLVEVRRLNALVIMQENALDELSFASCLGVDERQMELMLGKGAKKKIADNLARLMEQTFSKSVYWLDQGGDGQGASGSSFDLFG